MDTQGSLSSDVLTGCTSSLRTYRAPDGSHGRAISFSVIAVTDGPFAETKQVIGGIAIIQASSKQEAIKHTKYFLQVAGGGETDFRRVHQAPTPSTTDGQGEPACRLSPCSAALPRSSGCVFLAGLARTDAPENRPYSYRSARIGSMRLARRAGISPANAATAISTATLISAIDGSPGLMP